MCNSYGSKLIELMQQLNLMLWNCREFCIEPQWTRIMPKLEQYSIVDYVASDTDLLKCSSFFACGLGRYWNFRSPFVMG